MGEKMTPTLDGKLRCLQSLLQQMGASVACKTVGEARDALLTAHITQPAQAVDVGAGSAHKGECPVKMARAICEAIVKHQFQDEHRHGRLTLDVETFLHEFNAARDSGATRALGNAQAEGWRVPGLDVEDWKVLARLRAALPDVGLNGWLRGVAVLDKLLALSPTPPQPEE